jgi:hypothetical protein
MARLRWAALTCLVIATSIACSTTPHSVITTGADGLRTFTVIRAIDGVPVVCPSFAVLDPVAGTFDGQVGAQDPVWIAVEDGRHLSVIWPEGFSVRFEPEAVLYNENDHAVARAHEPTELSQVKPEDHSGSFDDPYIASGLLYDGCYPYVP